MLLAPHEGIKVDQGRKLEHWCTERTSGSLLFFTALEAIRCSEHLTASDESSRIHPPASPNNETDDSIA